MRESNKQTLRIIIGLLTFVMTVSAAAAQTISGGKYTISSSVVAGGGGTSTGAGNKMIEGTTGQPAAGGPNSKLAYSHDPGFWPTALTQPGPTPTATPTPTPTATPGISITDVSLAEGNSGTGSFTFTMLLSSASNQTVTVSYATADGTAASFSDYQAANGLVTFNPGEVSKFVVVMVNGDTQTEPDETFFVNLSGPVSASIIKGQGIGTILNDDSVPVAQLQFSQSFYAATEDLTAVSITVTRTGDTSGTATVDYQSVDGSATQKGDFEFVGGRLTFAPGETSKTFDVLINEDMYTDQNESFSVTLSNPAGAILGTQSTATITITDDVPESPSNPIDDAQSFVHTQYHDFLNREPDAAGLAFWTNEITSCGTDQQCIEARRVNVSAAFFLSIEFQETGYLVDRIYKAAYGNLPNSPVPLKVSELLTDAQEIGRGLVVQKPGWQQVLETNKQEFTTEFVQRARFIQAFPIMLTPAQFADGLFANAGISPSSAERTAVIDEFAGAGNTVDVGARAHALRLVAENQMLAQQEFNGAFVLMQYIGYLRRNPIDDPEPALNYDGYNFWLNKLNNFNGDYINAEMVKAFITSIEYRQRFGP